jgi:excisionase family DNA binding protein
MSAQFLMTITEDEFKRLLREALTEILGETPEVSKQQPTEILDMQQASEFLKLKPSTLYEKTSRKQIPHFKKGNKLYFYLTELQQWVKQGKIKTIEEIACEAITFTLNKKIA